MCTALAVALVAVSCGKRLAQASPISTAATSGWYYKSPHACTNSDGPDTQKCRADAENWGCAGDVDTLYCGEDEKQTCKEMGSRVSVEKPEGFGFMCPSLMLGTAEMLAAAKADRYDGAYGVVTIDALSCGQCVEIENDDPKHYPNAPTITAQVFNSVANSVDVYMAGGGLGANNGCAAVKDYTPMASMYKKYPTAANAEFVQHLKKIGYKDAEEQIDEVISYAGGLRGGRAYAECMASGKNTSTQCQPPDNGCDGNGGICITDPLVACPLAFQGKSDFVTQKAVESCLYAFEHDLHWNRPITYQAVPCPPGLTAITGMVPDAAGQNMPRGEKVKSTTTTMEDCCEPTCSRTSAGKNSKEPGSWMPGREVIHTCNIAGEPFLESTALVPNPCEADSAESGGQGQPVSGGWGGQSGAAQQATGSVGQLTQGSISQPGSIQIQNTQSAGYGVPAASDWGANGGSTQQSVLAVGGVQQSGLAVGGVGGVQELTQGSGGDQGSRPSAPHSEATTTTTVLETTTTLQETTTAAPETTTAWSLPSQGARQQPAAHGQGMPQGQAGSADLDMVMASHRSRGATFPVQAQSSGLTSSAAGSMWDVAGAPTPARGAVRQAQPPTAGPANPMLVSPSSGFAPSTGAVQGTGAAPLEATGGVHCSAAYAQCGGDGWAGATCCQGSCTCTAYAGSYSQCVPPDGGASCGSVGQLPNDGSMMIVRKDSLHSSLPQAAESASSHARTEATMLVGIAVALSSAAALYAFSSRVCAPAMRRGRGSSGAAGEEPCRHFLALERGDDTHALIAAQHDH